jgi:hypothetical protein
MCNFWPAWLPSHSIGRAGGKDSLLDSHQWLKWVKNNYRSEIRTSIVPTENGIEIPSIFHGVFFDETKLKVRCTHARLHLLNWYTRAHCTSHQIQWRTSWPGKVVEWFGIHFDIYGVPFSHLESFEWATSISNGWVPILNHYGIMAPQLPKSIQSKLQWIQLDPNGLWGHWKKLKLPHIWFIMTLHQDTTPESQLLYDSMMMDGQVRNVIHSFVYVHAKWLRSIGDSTQKRYVSAHSRHYGITLH